MPPWLKEKWIEWLGPERIYELYGGTEAAGRHDHFGRRMARTSRLGRQDRRHLRACASSAKTATTSPAGETGEIYFLPNDGAGSTYHYLGAEPKRRPDGWESLGDIGRLDAEGYLYLGDRLADMILRGGANIYPAEIEAAVTDTSRRAFLRCRRPARSGIRAARARHPRTRREHRCASGRRRHGGVPFRPAQPLQASGKFRGHKRRLARRFRQGSPHACCATSAPAGSGITARSGSCPPARRQRRSKRCATEHL